MADEQVCGQADQIESELEDLREELENFQKEKERVRAILGRIGGVPKTRVRLVNTLFIVIVASDVIVSIVAGEQFTRTEHPHRDGRMNPDIVLREPRLFGSSAAPRQEYQVCFTSLSPRPPSMAFRRLQCVRPAPQRSRLRRETKKAPLEERGPRSFQSESSAAPLPWTDVCRLRSFPALPHHILHILTLDKRFEPVGLDIREMHEQVLASVVRRNEAEPLLGIKPLHLASAHNATPSSLCAAGI